MAEEWKDIEEFEGFYQVSNLGRVKRVGHFSNYKGNGLRFLPERIKVQSFDKDGYKTVSLYARSKMKLCRVHVLVGKAFIPNPRNLPQINHKDEDKTNNRVDNLEWCTSYYNNNYGTKNLRTAETKRKQHRCYCNTRDGKGRFARC